MQGEREGTVVRVEGSTCLVRIDEREGPPRTERCEVRRSLRWAAGEPDEPERGRGEDEGRGPERLATGDRVVLASGPHAVIEAVRRRRTKLSRLAPDPHDRGRRRREQVIAVNIDQLAIIVSCRDPEWRPGLVDRLLIAAEAGGFDAIIFVNKSDLLDDEGRATIARDGAVFEQLGYRAVLTSARTGEGLDQVREALRGRTTAVAGPSGVGKSTMLNAVEPGLELRTAAVSEATGKGRHTTTAVSLLPLAGGGFVLDTPGVREFGFLDVGPAGLRFLFREFVELAARCRYPDCVHDHEPGCAIRAAVAKGEISPRRYQSYLRIRETLS